MAKWSKDYWGQKEQNKQKAIAHYQMVEKEYIGYTQNSILKSCILDKTSVPITTDKVKTKNPEIAILDQTTVDCIINIGMKFFDKRIGVLNFASYKNPGGKFLEGSMAQEESLCHNSNLYNILSYFKDYYAYNRSHINRSLYEDRAIYSPEVIFFRKMGGVHTFADVITCAAPNINAARRNHNVEFFENHQALYNRCKFVLDIAQMVGIDILILGAYGCGVFGQDPYQVARIFKDLLTSRYSKYTFDTVIFAIPSTGHSINNYNAFRSVFGI